MKLFCRWLLACATVSAALSQNPTATLIGTVLDAHGAVVPAAALEVRNTGNNEIRKTASDGKGEFTVANLVPGRYEVTIAKEGFRTRREIDIELVVDQVARMQFRLEVGGVTQTVEVTAAAAPLINTENSTKSDVMTGDEIIEMPLNGRAVTDLAQLVPGVVPNAQGSQGGPFAVNGARSDNTNFLMNGFNNEDPQTGGGPIVGPNLDAVQEFKMETNNYSAEHGRLAGGVMNVVMKSGGNKIHGAVFEFLRNDIFDARGFFDKQTSKLRQNEFGGLVSGPVLLPKVYNGRDHTFFLFSSESFRQTQGQTKLAVVPTAAQRLGDFSGSAPIKDPLATGACTAAGGPACFPGNRIPASRLNPVALKAQAYYPPANQTGVNNYLSYATSPNNWDRFMIKVDQHATSKDTISFLYSMQHNASSNPFAGGQNIAFFGQNPDNRVQMAGLTYTRLFTPALINEVRLGYTYTNATNINLDAGHDFNQEWGLPGPANPRLLGSPMIVISGYNNLGDGQNIPQVRHSMITQPSDTLTWVKGRHLAKFGFELLHTAFNQPSTDNSRGTFNFTGAWSGNAYADFMLGLLNSDTHLVLNPVNYFRINNYGFFAQDDWKITSRLTLNLGVRWDIPEPPYEKYGQVTNFLPETEKLVIGSAKMLPAGVSFTSPNGVVFADQAGLPQLAYTRYNDVAPRLGFAWRPFGGNRFVVRSGFGTFFGGNQANPLRNQLANNTFPFGVTQQVVRNAADPNFLTFSNPYPVPASFSGNLSTIAVTGYEQHGKTPRLDAWNFTIEREVGRSAAVEASYTASKGTHLPWYFNINQVFWPPRPAPNNVPYSGFGTINYFAYEVNSNYNAGTLTFRRRFVSGFFYNFSYQFGKAIDEGSSLTNGGVGGITGFQNVRCSRCDRGRADFDIQQTFTMRFSWLSPFKRNIVTRGWQLAGSGYLYSGASFTPLVTNTGVGQPNRPNRIANGRLDDPTPNRWFDVSAFPPVPLNSFQFGNSGRNILDGPGRIVTNSALSRNFKFRESDNLQFRWELFNVSNHPNFNLPVTAVNAANAATITSAGSGRLMQFALRYSF
jgi:hypothetical protein